MKDYKNIPLTTPTPLFTKADKRRIVAEFSTLILIVVTVFAVFGLFALMANTSQPNLTPDVAEGVRK